MTIRATQHPITVNKKLNGGRPMTNAEEKSAELDRVRSAVVLGAEITGWAGGGALGTLIAGPWGGAAGGATGVVLARSLMATGADMVDRLLSRRERMRVGAAIAIAAAVTEERLAAGDTPRDDDFLSSGAGRAPVDEITEGVLLAAQRAYDEKKVPYLGRLSANLNFRRDVDVASATVLVRIADQLSYQQLCLLRICHDNGGTRPLVGGKPEGRTKSLAHGALLSDLLELSRIGLIKSGETIVLQLGDIDPPACRTQLFGEYLFQLMQLDLVDDADVERLRAVFETPEPTYITTTVQSNAAQSGNYRTLATSTLMGSVTTQIGDLLAGEGAMD